jgi:hypothetical protein
MSEEKRCSVVGCKSTTEAQLCDFEEIKWSAFRIGQGEIICFCPNHQEEMQRELFISSKKETKK